MMCYFCYIQGIMATRVLGHSPRAWAAFYPIAWVDQEARVYITYYVCRTSGGV